MNRFLKLLTLFLVLVMLVQSSVISIFAIKPLEVDTGIYQATGQPSKYSSQYNSGQRDVVATTLNGTSADAYYNGSYEYDVLSTKSQTEIKNSLATLMKNTHSYTSSYNDCHYKANRTDCENENGRVSLIYTGYSATMDQWNGWNREHVWPQSLGGGNTTGGGADLHHIRPSDAGVNSSRGNKKYGDSNNGTAKNGTNPAVGVLGGHYNSTYFEPLDNVKGDVARIILYVWVRWGSSWGADSVTEVFQSIDILLEWCELDPVDTWELGRNEVVQDIQGNRNVFIDYPEYAWLVFGREVPADMVTPSGEAREGACDHVAGEDATCTQPQVCTKCGNEIVAALGHKWNSGAITTSPTCTATGVKTYTCSACGTTKTETLKANGHLYGAWVIDVEATETSKGSKHRDCSVCGNVETLEIPIIGHEHKYTTVVTPPSCTNEGYTTHTCSCGDYYIDSYKDYLDHNYKDGACTSCGQADPDFIPETPEYTASDFKNLVTKLMSGTYTGKQRYTKICEAVTIYNSLSESDKEAVSKQYERLVTIVTDYNVEVNSVNEESNVFDLGAVTILVSAVPFAAYSLLKKKEF